MEILSIYNRIVNQEKVRQLKARFEQLYRVFMSSKGAIRDTYISIINLESLLLRNALTLKEQIDKAIFQK